MSKTIFVGSVLFVFVAIVGGFAMYRPTSCPYREEKQQEARDAMDRGFTIYQVVDPDKYDCLDASPTYVPLTSPTPIIPKVSPR